MPNSQQQISALSRWSPVILYVYMHLLTTYLNESFLFQVPEEYTKAMKIENGWSLELGWGGVMTCFGASLLWLLLAKIMRYNPISLSWWRPKIGRILRCHRDRESKKCFKFLQCSCCSRNNEESDAAFIRGWVYYRTTTKTQMIPRLVNKCNLIHEDWSRITAAVPFETKKNGSVNERWKS